MKLIKLDAIDSTNDFLKELNKQENLENLTMVTSEFQTNGKGQRGAVWKSEKGKNLILSVLIKNPFITSTNMFDLSVITSLAVTRALKKWNIPELSIKWPNDIMSYNKKIGGILIENILKNDGGVTSIVGIGINVNQTNFVNLPKASSLAVICEKEFNKSLLPNLIALELENLQEEWVTNPKMIWNTYLSSLFKIQVPVAFLNNKKNTFMGIITGVLPTGEIQIKLEDDSIVSFEIKEIQMQY